MIFIVKLTAFAKTNEDTGQTKMAVRKEIQVRSKMVRLGVPAAVETFPIGRTIVR